MDQLTFSLITNPKIKLLLCTYIYLKNTLSLLESENIEIVLKVFNPANAPEVRPIEDFWTEIKKLVYDDGWEAEDLDHLKYFILILSGFYAITCYNQKNYLAPIRPKKKSLEKLTQNTFVSFVNLKLKTQKK